MAVTIGRLSMIKEKYYNLLYHLTWSLEEVLLNVNIHAS